jgi:hypothetical protein
VSPSAFSVLTSNEIGDFVPNSSEDGSGLRIDKVSFGGGVGFFMALAAMLIILQVPVMRWALVAVGLGIVFGVGLAYVRRR